MDKVTEQLDRLRHYCNELSACERPETLSPEEAELFDWGQELINEAINSVNEFRNSTLSDSQLKLNALVIMGDLVFATTLLARYLQIFPFQDTQKTNAASMRRKLAEKQAPIIDLRKMLLRTSYDLEALAVSRKDCDAVETEFRKLCEDNGIKGISGRQIQNYATEILKERRESSGNP